MSEQDPGRPDEQGLGPAVQEVSERTVKLVQAEIELAKTELAEKFNKLLKGTIIVAVVSVFLFWAIAIALFGLSYLVYDLGVGDEGDYFWGFFVVAGALVLLSLIGGFIAYRAFKAGTPPVPTQAIEEAQKIKETFVSSDEPSSPLPYDPPTYTGPTLDDEPDGGDKR